MIFYLQKLYLFDCRDKLFLKCHIQLNQLWFLMQCSLISGYFHDFTEEQNMMLKVFPDDNLRPIANNRKKEQEKDTSRLGISTILIQDAPAARPQRVASTATPPARRGCRPRFQRPLTGRCGYDDGAERRGDSGTHDVVAGDHDA
ncbi:hypothetical protein B296_00021451 [Ensete ventricosum]|uniref:Uncharacterized protein n=1 Tax=Ensete ventricosum TaxID=4639 RepID=A0A426Y1A7_ENSVE|nr:hypothetical protein B296_00021451 [Ensete ventricosum]